jgi:hypothetical protein
VCVCVCVYVCVFACVCCYHFLRDRGGRGGAPREGPSSAGKGAAAAAAAAAVALPRCPILRRGLGQEAMAGVQRRGTGAVTGVGARNVAGVFDGASRAGRRLR